MESNIFTIKDLETLSGVKAHTLRIWEYRYGFLKPHRTDTNLRYYFPQELKTVLDISLLSKYGYRISQLDGMSREELRDRIMALEDRDAQQQRLINDLIGYMVDFDIEAFERVLDGYVLTHGIGKAVPGIIFPYLDRIGMLWVTGHINVAQEHLVSHVIRQKLIVGIAASASLPAAGSSTLADSASLRPAAGKTVLLFLPEGEHHELGLLYVYYLLKTHGVRVLYLGADLPLKDLESVCVQRKPDVLYSHLTGIAGNLNIEKYFTRLHQRVGIPLVVSGVLARAQLRKLPAAGVDFRQSISEVMAFIATL